MKLRYFFRYFFQIRRFCGITSLVVVSYDSCTSTSPPYRGIKSWWECCTFLSHSLHLCWSRPVPLGHIHCFVQSLMPILLVKLPVTFREPPASTMSDPSSENVALENVQDIYDAQQTAQARSVKTCRECSGADIMTSLFVSGNFADMVIKGKSKIWKVHRAVLLPQSTFLQKAFGGSSIVSEANMFSGQD